MKIRILYYVTDRLINNSLTDHFVNSYNVIIMIIIIMRNVASIADGRGAWLRLGRQNVDVHNNTSRHNIIRAISGRCLDFLWRPDRKFGDRPIRGSR